MSSADQNNIDALLAQVQAGADALQADAGAAAPPDAAGTAGAVAGEALAGEAVAAMDQAAAAMNEIAGDMEPPAAAPAGAATGLTMGAVAGAARISGSGISDVGRLLAIEVPVIVQLGMRRLTVGEVMRLAVGAIVEFGKSAEEELDLLVNNKPIGKGQAVKVGENFGIKVTTIGSVKETIKKLGAV